MTLVDCRTETTARRDSDYSPRVIVQAFWHERQTAWFDGLECAFRHFGDWPQEMMLDNAKAVVEHRAAATREVRFSERRGAGAPAGPTLAGAGAPPDGFGASRPRRRPP
jgi:transposase